MSFANVLYTIILYPLVQIIEISFMIFNKLFSNTGIAVLGVSLTVTLLCLPLYIVAEHWQQIERDTQAKLKPGIDRIKKAFKGDEQYMILSTFYKQNHYHPMMALRSSFGLLIQIPFFMAAYSCLSKLPALQGQSFLFIRDMGQQDAIFRIGNFPVNILPIAMTIINIIAGAIYTKGFPLKEKLQIYGMALIFLVLLYSSPAGLVLYWTMNNVFSLIKNIFYKLKNPLKVLYILMVAACIFVAVFVLFIYDGGASPKKRIAAALPMLLLTGIPIYLKGIKWLLDKPLALIVENKQNRLKLFLFSAAGLAILTGLVLPSNLISSSVQEFSNIESYTSPNNFLYAPFWQSIGLFLFWPICIYFLFNKRIQTLIAALFSILLVTFSVNAYAFSGNYGSMDITLKFIGGIQAQTKLFIVLNLIVNLVLILIIPFILSRKKNIIYTNLMLIAFVSFSLLGIINISKIKREYKAFETAQEQNSHASENDFTTRFHLSKKQKNVIVIMLDRAESSYFPHIVQNFPELNESFSGFTFYPNTLSFNGHTLMGSPGIYGGYEYTPYEMNKRQNESLKDKHNEALLLMPRIFTEQADFTASVSDLSWGNYNYITDLSFMNSYEKISTNILNGRYTGELKKTLTLSNQTSLIQNANRNLFWVSLFRQAPAAIRPAIYYKGSWWGEEGAVDTDSFLDWYGPLYFLPQITDFNSNTGSFILMTNEATHSNEEIPYLEITNRINHFEDTKSGYDIDVACLIKLADFFDYLKENNTYDNTRIIIIADHGIGYGPTCTENYDKASLSNGYTKDHLNPLLLVKDFDSTGTLKTDNSFMTNADTPALALKGIVENPVNPFTNKPINLDYKTNGVFVTIDDIFMPHHSKSSNIFTVKDDYWYKIKDNIFIDENWIQEVPND